MDRVCRIITGPPDRFTDRQIAAFVRMAAANGAMGEGLIERVRAARVLSVLVDGRVLVGIAGIKVPHEAYRTDVFHRAGADDVLERFPLEFGWAYLAPGLRARGHDRTMLGACLEAVRGANVFATSRSGRDALARLAERHGFLPLGRPYRSRRGEYDLMLFGKENSSAPTPPPVSPRAARAGAW